MLTGKRKSLYEAQKKFWDDQPLGLVSDIEIAKRTGYDKTTVTYQRSKRGIPRFGRVDWGQVPFGTKSDKQLSKELGVNQSSVTYQRNKRGIEGVHPGPPPKDKRINWDKMPLGKFPDTELAAFLGINVSCVEQQRNKRGIPRYYASKATCPCGKPTANGSMYCSAKCCRKIIAARKWCGIYRSRGGSWSSRNHILDKCFLALYELVETTKRVLGKRKIKT